MNPFLAYLWPCLAGGLLAGGISGLFAFRRKRWSPLIIAALLAIANAAAWHGPVGAADRFRATIERQAREALDNYEMTRVTAHLHHAPLTRRLVLVGRVDDWQTGELVRLFSHLPGVSRATWSERDAGLPLIVEAVAAAIGGFLLGLLLAYLLELRRRYNAQWTW
ncbi:MAG: hypothetical protein ACJ8FO_05135 [Sphingomicrobium sp.]